MSKVAVQTQHNSYMNKRYVLSGIVFVDKKMFRIQQNRNKIEENTICWAIKSTHDKYTK